MEIRLKDFNICVIRFFKVKNRGNGRVVIYKEITVKNYLVLKKIRVF